MKPLSSAAKDFNSDSDCAVILFQLDTEQLAVRAKCLQLEVGAQRAPRHLVFI